MEHTTEDKSVTELRESFTYSVRDISEAIDLSEDKVRQLMHLGWINWIRIGREMRVTREEMLRILREGTSSDAKPKISQLSRT